MEKVFFADVDIMSLIFLIMFALSIAGISIVLLFMNKPYKDDYRN